MDSGDPYFIGWTVFITLGGPRRSMTPQSLIRNLEGGPKIVAGFPILNSCLGGGLPCNSITEAMGESGWDKTQLCLKLSLLAQLPPAHGGLCASPMYIHNDFNFPFRWLQQLGHYIRSSPKTNPCDHIYVHDVEDTHQLVYLFGRVEAFSAKGEVRLAVRFVVIDYMAPLFSGVIWQHLTEVTFRFVFQNFWEIESVGKQVWCGCGSDQ